MPVPIFAPPSPLGEGPGVRAPGPRQGSPFGAVEPSHPPCQRITPAVVVTPHSPRSTPYVLRRRKAATAPTTIIAIVPGSGTLLPFAVSETEPLVPYALYQRV